GPEIFDHDISFAAQVPEKTLSFGLAQIQRDGLLVATDDGPPHRGRAALLWAPGAPGIALARCFDLDDLRAQVAEQLAAERPCDQGAEFEDAQVGQWAARRRRGGGRGGAHGGATCTGARREGQARAQAPFPLEWRHVSRRTHRDRRSRTARRAAE